MGSRSHGRLETELRGCFSSFRVWAEAVSPGCTRKRGGGDGGGKGGVLRSRSTTEGGRPRSLYNWKPVFGTKLLGFSIGTGLGALTPVLQKKCFLYGGYAGAVSASLHRYQALRVQGWGPSIAAQGFRGHC